MTDFTNALVTGASSGMGRGLALALARRGTQVFAAARRRAELESLVDEITRAGGRAEALVLDVADGDATHATVAALDARAPLDLVIANAGTGALTPAQAFEWRDVKRVFEVNLLGAAATIAGALPGMVARNRGHVVGISSLAARRGLPRFGAYSASKAALSTLLESLRVDLHGSGVHVTTVLPGFVKTEMTAKNKFTMPFLVDCDRAVEIILTAVLRQEAECAFPLPMAAAMRVLPLVPNALYALVASRSPNTPVSDT